jgi:hypothetical protein
MTVLMLLFLHKTMSRICMLSIVILDLCFEHSCERFHPCPNICKPVKIMLDFMAIV